MIRLRSLLDVRPESETRLLPFEDAVSIPFDELPGRMGELPRPPAIRLAECGPVTDEAATFLESRGFMVERRVARPGKHMEQGRLWSPNPWLEAVVPHLELDPSSRILDLGSGGCRDAIFLASLAGPVIATDWLPDAIERGRCLAGRYGLAESLSGLVCDLEAGPPPIRGQFDLVACFFFLDRNLIRWACQSLAPGGSLVAETFTEQQRARFGRPRRERLVLRSGEWPELAEGLEIAGHSEEWRADGRHTARLWARKPLTSP